MRSGISFSDAGLPSSVGRWSRPTPPPPPPSNLLQILYHMCSLTLTPSSCVTPVMLTKRYHEQNALLTSSFYPQRENETGVKMLRWYCKLLVPADDRGFAHTCDLSVVFLSYAAGEVGPGRT